MKTLLSISACALTLSGGLMAASDIDHALEICAEETRAGSTVYARAGRFTISAQPGSDGGSWEVTLQVDPMFSSSLALRFASSQEYELRLRDSRGRVLWTWSADKVFPPAEHIRSASGWTAKASVPHPARALEGMEPYTLEAWLTVAEGEAPFAVATTVALGGD